MAGNDAEKEIPEAEAAQGPETGEESTSGDGDNTSASGSEGQPDNDIDLQINAAVSAALAEQQEIVLRAQAEVQNMRRRCEQDVERAHKFALEKFSGELLTVMDNLERALQAVTNKDDDNVKALYEGVELTQKGFLETLNKFDIVQVDPVGEPFDPQQHEAMSMVENNDVEPNTVLNVVQKGYLLNGRVIRPAMVMVSRASAK